MNSKLHENVPSKMISYHCGRLLRHRPREKTKLKDGGQKYIASTKICAHVPIVILKTTKIPLGYLSTKPKKCLN